jgi:hypothetical protein
MSGVDLPVTVRTRGLTGAGRVYDLANDGCLLGCRHGLIGAGATVALNFPGGLRLNGRAMLLHGTVARIEFDHPLHDAVLDHLVESAGPANDCATKEPQRRNGLRPAL